MRIIDRIIAPLGRRVDESSPMVDARLRRRLAASTPSSRRSSLVGPVLTIRKFAASPLTVDDLIRFGTSTPEMFDFLRACVEARLNIFVSGGTGSGKTTMLNVLSSFIPDDERIVTIEDAAELQLRQEHVVTLEARPPNIEGKGAIPIRELVRNALRMRPDRIIVGECRGGEALDMLQAMNTGHDGSMSTGHANTPARHARPPRDDGADGRRRPAAARHPRADRLGRRPDRAPGAHARRHAQDHRTSPRSRAWKATSSCCRTCSSSSRPASSRARSRAACKPTGVRPQASAEKFEVMGIHLPPGLFGASVLDEPLDGSHRRLRRGRRRGRRPARLLGLSAAADDASARRSSATRPPGGGRAGERSASGLARARSAAPRALTDFNRSSSAATGAPNLARELARADLALKPSRVPRHPRRRDRGHRRRRASCSAHDPACLGNPLRVAGRPSSSAGGCRASGSAGARASASRRSTPASPTRSRCIANSLRAGSSFLQAIEMVVRETQPPISTEFARVIREVNLGLPLEQALPTWSGASARTTSS